MALMLRAIEVSYTTTADDDMGNPVEVDLSLRGKLTATVEYFDDSAPSQVLHTQRFELSASETEEEILERFRQAGRRIRDARVRTNELAQYAGIAFPLDVE